MARRWFAKTRLMKAFVKAYTRVLATKGWETHINIADDGTVWIDGVQTTLDRKAVVVTNPLVKAVVKAYRGDVYALQAAARQKNAGAITSRRNRGSSSSASCGSARSI